jgi:integrase
MDYKLEKASKEAGIPQTRWHRLRRYFATQSDRLGMPQQDRQRTLGHSSAAMTTHYTEEDLDRRRPFIEQIAQGLLNAIKAGAAEQSTTTTALPDKTKADE